MEERLTNKANHLEDELETVRLQLAQVNEQLETAKKELNRERAKNKSVNRQTEVSIMVYNTAVFEYYK